MSTGVCCTPCSCNDVEHSEVITEIQTIREDLVSTEAADLRQAGSSTPQHIIKDAGPQEILGDVLAGGVQKEVLPEKNEETAAAAPAEVSKEDEPVQEQQVAVAVDSANAARVSGLSASSEADSGINSKTPVLQINSTPELQEKDESEKMDEDEEQEAAEKRDAREFKKCALSAVLVIFVTCGILIPLRLAKAEFEEPLCPTEYNGPEPLICERCGEGTVFPHFGQWEQTWPLGLRTGLYLVGMVWCFLGVGMACDSFTAGIEHISAQNWVLWDEAPGGCMEQSFQPIWNPSVANLSLMALGSSAPEILLNVYEIIDPSKNYFSGQLGCSTIVGSAAFNLLVIIAVCISAIPEPDIRRIEAIGVFIVTATNSIFAYLWILFVLQVVTPDKVDVWEALVTLCFFPLLLGSAYIADIGLIRHLPCLSSVLPPRVSEHHSRVSRSRAQARRDLMHSMTGAGSSGASRSLCSSVGDSFNSTNTIVIGLEHRSYAYSERAQEVKVRVLKLGYCDTPVHIHYHTSEESGMEGVRFKPVDGIFIFQPEDTEFWITIPLLHETPVANSGKRVESFAVQISRIKERRSSQASQASTQSAEHSLDAAFHVSLGCTRSKVLILRDTEPGVLSFEKEGVTAWWGSSTISLAIDRTEGSVGNITVKYKTEGDTAIDGKDYTHVDQQVVFEEGNDVQWINIPIKEKRSGLGIRPKKFRVILHSPSEGVKLMSASSDRKSSKRGSSIFHQALRKSSQFGSSANLDCLGHTSCVVTLPTTAPKWLANLADAVSPTHLAIVCTAWLEEITEAFYCCGTPEDQSEASAVDWFFHCVSLPMKFLFVIIPPVQLFSGWATFSMALLVIGFITALIKDLAELVGCSLGRAIWGEAISSDIIALTLVALGTSLPDTIASKTAAESDDTADNSIGNVTGSNSVNVFLGLGLPWTIGAVYWAFQGKTEKWKKHYYRNKNFEVVWGTTYPEGGFIVPADSLGFSVALFTCLALVCLVLLVFRRFRYGGELGGPKMAQYRDSIFLVVLWFGFIVVSIFQSQGRDP